MLHFQALPIEVLDLVMENVVLTIGIQKAVLLRVASRAFNSAILNAVCISQVVDMEDPATADLKHRMDRRLLAKILLVKSLATSQPKEAYLAVIAKVNQTLDALAGTSNGDQSRHRQEAIAGAVSLVDDWHCDAKVEAQNLLSGAVIAGDLSVVKALLRNDANLPQSPDVNDSTPFFRDLLTLAAGCGYVDIVQFLLDCGACPDAAYSKWRESVRLASQSDWNMHYCNVELRGRVLSQQPPSALRAAVHGGHTDIVRILLDPRHRFPENNLEYLRAILAGAEAGRLDLIQAVFETIGKDMSDFPELGTEMMWRAVRHRHRNVVEMLLANGVDVNAAAGSPRRDSSALQIAAAVGDITMVDFLIQRGADVNANILHNFNSFPIQAAARCGHEDIVLLLITHGADSKEALLQAARYDHPRLVRSLRSTVPSLLREEKGEVAKHALQEAVFAGNLTIISILVAAGVPLNDGYGKQGELPLNMAKRLPAPWVVDHLLSLGAQETDQKLRSGVLRHDARRVRVSERTWQWVGKH